METFNDNPKVLCDPVPLPPTISLIQHVSLAFPLQPPATLDSLVSVNMLSTPCSSSSSPHTWLLPSFWLSSKVTCVDGLPPGAPFPHRDTLSVALCGWFHSIYHNVSSCFLNCFSSLSPASLNPVCLIPSSTSQDTWHTDFPHLLKSKLIYRSYINLSSTCDDNS